MASTVLWVTYSKTSVLSFACEAVRTTKHGYLELEYIDAGNPKVARQAVASQRGTAAIDAQQT